MSERVKEVTDNSFQRKVLQANKAVPVDFWADQVLEIFDGDAEPAIRIVSDESLDSCCLQSRVIEFPSESNWQ
jgi:hypothetical protein